MKRVSMAKTPSSVSGLISPPELVTMKVRPWLMVMPGGATLISIGMGFSFFYYCLDDAQDCSGWSAICILDLERKAHQFVHSGFYIGQVKTLNEPDASLKQRMVGLDSVFVKTTD